MLVILCISGFGHIKCDGTEKLSSGSLCNADDREIKFNIKYYVGSYEMKYYRIIDCVCSKYIYIYNT